MKENVGVIDVGSNSVRLLLTSGDKGEKTVIVTALADNMEKGKKLNEQSVSRTVEAVRLLFLQAKNKRASKVYIFATEAVRKAENRAEFCEKVYLETGETVDVVDGKTEAKLGLLGALNGLDGGIIDVGGASTEIAISNDKKFTYQKSVDIGSVKINNLCGQDAKQIEDLAKEYSPKFKPPQCDNYYAIGGTATTLAGIAQNLVPYDPNKVDGYYLSAEKIKDLANELFLLSVEERVRKYNLIERRAKVIAGGALWLYQVLKELNIHGVTVSEKDNLEGYLLYKGET